LDVDETAVYWLSRLTAGGDTTTYVKRLAR
jgi:hypothetical protein